jgi:hypothetical protein
MDDVVEVVSFKLAEEGVSARFLDANKKLNVWLLTQPGFVSRHLSSSEDGGWVDVVHWKSLGEAQLAGGKIMTEMGDSDCMRLIDFPSIKMSHNQLQLAC